MKISKFYLKQQKQRNKRNKRKIRIIYNINRRRKKNSN